MILKNLCKLSLGALACLSVAFSGYTENALKVLADGSIPPDVSSDGGLPDKPYNMGMFDTFNLADREIYRQTGYVDLGSLDWRIQNVADGKKAFRANISDILAVASSSIDAFVYSAKYETLNGDLTYRGVTGISMWSTTQDICVYDSSFDGSTAAFFKASVSGSWIQYKNNHPELDYFDDAINGDNARSAYSEGFSSGFSAGYAALDGLQYITIVNDGDYAFNLTVYDSSSNNPIFNAYVAVGDSVSYTRNPGVTCHFMFSSTQSSWPYFGFTVALDGVNYTLINSMIVNDYIYMPTWYKNVTIRAFANNNSQFESQFDGLRFSPSELEYVYIGDNNMIRSIYSEGYDAGRQDGYDEGADSGRSEGYSYGYASGYSAGNVNGYGDGVAAGGGNFQVIDIWGLMSAVITMPFTFFSQGLDWTLFAGSPYEFSVSIFFGSLLVILMLWKIIQLVIGLGK